MNLVMLYLKAYRLRYPEPENPSGGDSDKDKKPKESEQKPEESNVELAKALKEARENSVSKEEYERLKNENKKLVSEIINGGGDGSGHSESKEQPDIAKLREELYGPKCSELSNLDYWKKTLELRKAIIDAGDPDPFLPIGAKISPTDDDAKAANNVATVVQECIDEADGNSEVFTALLQSRTNNDSPQMILHLKKLGIKYK